MTNSLTKLDFHVDVDVNVDVNVATMSNSMLAPYYSFFVVHHVQLHVATFFVGHHADYHVGHHNVASTLCEG